MTQINDKTIIAIVGLTNVGKSTLFNYLLSQNKAIVDSTAGTTADNVIASMEIHGLGKVKLIDTAGIDESGVLGDKKREKTKKTIMETDLVLFVIKNNINNLTDYEKLMIEYIKEKNKKILIICNDFDNTNNTNNIKYLEWNNIQSIFINLNRQNQQNILTEFILNNYKKKDNIVNLLPDIKIKNSYVLLVIPLDEESPESRLLRPQSLVIERLLQSFAIPVLYRPDLKNFNKNEFIDIINNLRNSNKNLSLIITDSQAINIIYDYIPTDINFTSFSILMSNFMSNGKLLEFIKGASELDKLNNNDSILIMETCNHNRKCNDIGTIQLPNAIKKYTNKNINIDYIFGKDFLSDEELKLKNYKLIITCGGCMVEKQQYSNRLEMIKNLNIPISNYGIVFSYIKNKAILKNIYKLFKL